jgi:hypothetical protein
MNDAVDVVAKIRRITMIESDNGVLVGGENHPREGVAIGD